MSPSKTQKTKRIDMKIDWRSNSSELNDVCLDCGFLLSHSCVECIDCPVNRLKIRLRKKLKIIGIPNYKKVNHQTKKK